MKKLLLILIPLVVFVVLLTFSFTCPNKTAHVRTLETDINVAPTSNASIDSISAKKILKNIEFSNYILFSKADCTTKDSSFNVSYGVLGSVHTKSLDKMRRLIESN